MRSKTFLPISVIFMIVAMLGMIVSCGDTFVRNAEISVKSRYKLMLSCDDGGQIEVSPEKADYLAGETVTIRAVPDEGYSFRCWSDGVQETERAVVMNADTSLSAEFSERSWTIVVYMAADNDLEAAAILDINEMEAADFKSGGLTVLALICFISFSSFLSYASFPLVSFRMARTTTENTTINRARPYAFTDLILLNTSENLSHSRSL